MERDLPKILATVSRVDKTEIFGLGSLRNGRGGVAQRRALRRAARADDHQDWRDLCQVYVPARLATVSSDLDKKSHLGQSVSGSCIFCRKFMQNYTCKAIS